MSRTRNNGKLQLAGGLFVFLLSVGLLHLSTDTVFMLYPVFAVNILLLLVMLVILLWRNLVAGSAVQQTIVYNLRRLVTTLVRVNVEFMQSHPLSSQSVQRQKVIREVTFFLIAQNCMASPSKFMWLYSLTAYRFAADLIHNYVTSCHVHSEATSHVDHAIETSTVENREGDADSRSTDEVYHDYIHLAVYMFKAFLILIVANYQISRVKLLYSIVTLLYFISVEGMLEACLTRSLENEQFDIIEGLEQHYVRVAHGITELSLTVYFMIWALVTNQQMLMLVALYTNVYSQGRHLFQNTICAVFAEWSVLAHFEKASQNELVSLDDVCAVCLTVMRKARKTPCKHYFHGHCLRRSLKVKNSCPICSFKFQFFVH